MKTCVCLVVITAFCFCSLSAAIITVDNSTPSIGDYVNFQSAYDNAVSGDTIYVYPSMSDYGVFALYKSLTIIGGGCNPVNPLMPASDIVISFGPGSSGSIISGLCSDWGWLALEVNDITISNCTYSSLEVRSSGNAIRDSKFAGCTLGNGTDPISNNVFTGCQFESQGTNLNLTPFSATTFMNCTFQNSVWWYGNIGANIPSTGVFSHCLFLDPAGNQYSLINGDGGGLSFTECIFQRMNDFETNAQFHYCILGGHFGYVDPTNQQNVDMAQVMVDVANGDYHLCPGSLASGAGFEGTDIGIYGGNSPFSDKWYLTALPSITLFESSPIVNQAGELNVHVEAQSWN